MSGIILLALLVLCNWSPSSLADNNPLQDLCPTASPPNPIFLNGHLCKNPTTITASDFKTSKLNHAGNTDNYARSSTNILTPADFPGLNTMGISIARTDMAMDGAVLPHYHPRATEILFVSLGTVIVGFGDSKGRLFLKTLREGDVFLVPRALPHFCVNAGYGLATFFSALNSQNPGFVSLVGNPYSSSNDTPLLPRLLSLRTNFAMDSNHTSTTASSSFDFFM
ncbi:hypothetical protein DsansV1_C30g0214051 [Dioscorea sansibarensis]